MNRITQCLHGRGTVSSVMHHRHGPAGSVPGRYLAFTGMRRPVVFWNLTDRCNLACTHCYSRSGPERGQSGELRTSEAFVVIDDLAEMGVPLILFSGGEPLLREDLWDLSRHARKRGIKVALSTNGTLLDGPAAGRIRESGIEYAGISLDGARATTHDRFRNSPGAFDRACAAFGHCRKEGIRCGVRITLTRQNFTELEDLIGLSQDLGASRFCLYWLVPSGRGREHYAGLQLKKDEIVSALDLLYRKAMETDPSSMEFLTVDAPQDCIHLLGSMERAQSADLPEARELVGSLKGGCSAGDRVANIDPQGNVYPCQFARSGEFFIGNVRRERFSRLWEDSHNPVLARFRERPRALDGTCGACGHRELCGGGCRVRAYEASGNFSAEDPFCFVETRTGSA
jgi:Fe-coproporphyrin III synthase